MTSPDAEIRTFLQTLSLGAPVYDRVPEGLAYPYIHISDLSNADQFTSDQTIWEVELLLDIVTGFDTLAGGRKDADVIGNAVMTALCDVPYRDIGTYQIVKTTMLNSIYIDETSDSAYIVRKLMRFNMLLELTDAIPVPAPPVVMSAEVESSTRINVLFSKAMNPDVTLSSFALWINGVLSNISDVEFPGDEPILVISVNGSTELFEAGDVVTLAITSGLLAQDGGLFAGGTFSVTNDLEVVQPELLPVISDESDTWVDYGFRFMCSANVNPSGLATSVRIEYGTTTAFGSTVTLDPIPAGSADVAVYGLMPKLGVGVYYWRMIATNAEGQTIGDTQNFEVYTGTNRTRTTYTYPVFVSDKYYIDPDSGTNGVGSEADPFNTFPASIGNGYSYYLKRGTEIEYSGEFVDVGSCEIGAYGSGATPVIRCTQLNSDDNFKFIVIDSLVYIHDIKFEKPDITGLNLYFRTGSSDSYVKSIETEGWRYPVYTEATDFETQWDGLTIVYSTIHDCGYDGIVARYCSEIEIAHNYIYNVNLQFNIAGQEDQALSPGDCIQCNSGGTQVIYVHHNTLDHSTTGNKFCLIVASAEATLSCHHNHMICTHDFDGDNHPVSALYLSGSGLNIYNNLMEECTYGMYCYGDGAQFNYNIVVNPIIGVQVMDNHSCTVQNNLFIDYAVYGVAKLSGASITAINNVFRSTHEAVHLLSGGIVVNDHNHFDGCSASGTNSTTGDSVFTDDTNYDFTPDTLSPLLDSGIDVGLLNDFADVAITGLINKGAYQ